jgi:hypothetical protein
MFGDQDEAQEPAEEVTPEPEDDGLAVPDFLR